VAKQTYKTFGETVGGRSFPDAEDVKIEAIIGKPIIVKAADFKEMKHGEVAILLFNDPDNVDPNKDFSVLAGGEVIRKKVKEAIEKRLLPLVGTIMHDEVYYDIV